MRQDATLVIVERTTTRRIAVQQCTQDTTPGQEGRILMEALGRTQRARITIEQLGRSRGKRQRVFDRMDRI